MSAAVNGIVDCVSDPITFIGVKPANKVFQRDFAGSRQTKKRPSRIRGPDLIFAQIPFPNTEINRLRGHTHPFFTLPQGLVLVYQLSNIDTRTDVPGKSSLRVLAWHALVRYPAILPIVSTQAILHNGMAAAHRMPGYKARRTLAGRRDGRLQPSRRPTPDRCCVP